MPFGEVNYNGDFWISWKFFCVFMPDSKRQGFSASFDTNLKSQTALDREIWRFKDKESLRRNPALCKPVGVRLGHFFCKFHQNTHFYGTFWLFFAIWVIILQNCTKISFIFALFRFDLLARRAIAFTKSRKNALRRGQLQRRFLNKLKIFLRFYARFKKTRLFPFFWYQFEVSNCSRSWDMKV